MTSTKHFLAISAFFLLLFFVMPLAAHAHQPYVKKVGYIQDPKTNLIIKEKKYGDGIFTADPGKFQLRKQNGAVIASSPVGKHIATFCPSIQFCWAFPYSGSFITSGYYLDWKNIDFKAGAPEYDFKDNQEKRFKRYLRNVKARRFSANFLGYPEMENYESGFKKSRVSLFFSPLIIIKDQFSQLIVLFWLTLLPFLLFWLFFKWKRIERKILRYLVRGIGVLTLMSYAGFYALACFFLVFTLSTPIAYMLLSVVLGLNLGRYIYRKPFSKFQKEEETSSAKRQRASRPKISKRTQSTVFLLMFLGVVIYFNQFIRIIIFHKPALLSSKESSYRRDMLILDLDGDGLEVYARMDKTTYFDLNANGQASRTGWVAPDDGILVVDRDKDGQIGNYKELMVSLKRDAFKALSSYNDRNYFFYGDDKIDKNDKIYKDLLVWQDLNS